MIMEFIGIQKYQQSNIQLFAVPKGTTSTALAQPLDLSINGTMKQHRQNSWSKEYFMAPPPVDLVQNAVIRACENIMQNSMLLIQRYLKLLFNCLNLSLN
jgi:hypothetical protein